eukprot:c25951_g1_i1 orf=7-300(-)
MHYIVTKPTMLLPLTRQKNQVYTATLATTKRLCLIHHNNTLALMPIEAQFLRYEVEFNHRTYMYSLPTAFLYWHLFGHARHHCLYARKFWHCLLPAS